MFREVWDRGDLTNISKEFLDNLCPPISMTNRGIRLNLQIYFAKTANAALVEALSRVLTYAQQINNSTGKRNIVTFGAIKDRNDATENDEDTANATKDTQRLYKEIIAPLEKDFVGSLDLKRATRKEIHAIFQTVFGKEKIPATLLDHDERKATASALKKTDGTIWTEAELTALRENYFENATKQQQKKWLFWRNPTRLKASVSTPLLNHICIYLHDHGIPSMQGLDADQQEKIVDHVRPLDAGSSTPQFRTLSVRNFLAIFEEQPHKPEAEIQQNPSTPIGPI